MSNGKEKMYDIAEKGLGGIRTAFRGSRLGGGPGWLGYKTGQWAPGVNLGRPERRGVLGRLADKKALDQWGEGIGGPDDSIDKLGDDIYEERLSKPNNLMQLLLGNIAQAPYGAAQGPTFDDGTPAGPPPFEYFPQEDPEYGHLRYSHPRIFRDADGAANWFGERRREEHQRMMESGMTPEDRYRKNSGEYDWL